MSRNNYRQNEQLARLLRATAQVACIAICVAMARLVHASESERPCGPETDLRKSGTMSATLAVHQGSVGICYAESAASLIDAWRKKTGDQVSSFRTSGIELALRHHDHFGMTSDPLKVGGQICDAYSIAQAEGVCERRQVAQNLGNKDLIQALDLTWKAYREWKDSRPLLDRWSSYWNENSQAGHFKNQMRREYASTLKTCIAVNAPESGPVLPNLLEIEEILDKANSTNELIRSLALKSCKETDRVHFSGLPPCKSWVWRTESDDNRLAEVLAKQLEHGASLPVGISYCGHILKDEHPQQRRPSSAWDMGNKGFVEQCGPHASLLIGRRRHPKTGVCQYLIRNSWGMGCESYASRLQCESGSIWIDRDELLANTYGLSLLGE